MKKNRTGLKSHLRKIKNKFRRPVDIYFFSEEIEKLLKLRKGKCLRCGKCCKLLFRCPMLSEKSQDASCKIYKYRTKVCKLFPMRETDLKDVDYQCGFSFTK